MQNSTNVVIPVDTLKGHPSGYQGIRWNDRNLVVLLPFMENTFMPVWEYWTAYPKDFQAAKAGVEPFASWLKLAAETIVPIPRFNPPKPVEVPGANLRDPVSIVVVGRETLPVWYAGNFDYIASASVDKWK